MQDANVGTGYTGLLQPKLEDFGLKDSDLHEVSMELSRLTDIRRPLTVHNIDAWGNSAPIALLIALMIPGFLGGGMLKVLIAIPAAALVGGVIAWLIDGGYRRLFFSKWFAREPARPEMVGKVKAFQDYEWCLYHWRRSASGNRYSLGPDQMLDSEVRCWWNGRTRFIPSPVAYGRTDDVSFIEEWKPWDCLAESQQNVVRFLFWRTRSNNMEIAFKITLAIALASVLFGILGFQSYPEP
jgi:hypothetical protein